MSMSLKKLPRLSRPRAPMVQADISPSGAPLHAGDSPSRQHLFSSPTAVQPDLPSVLKGLHILSFLVEVQKSRSLVSISRGPCPQVPEAGATGGPKDERGAGFHRPVTRNTGCNQEKLPSESLSKPEQSWLDRPLTRLDAAAPVFCAPRPGEDQSFVVGDFLPFLF